jgi:hypothetical protein
VPKIFLRIEKNRVIVPDIFLMGMTYIKDHFLTSLAENNDLNFLLKMKNNINLQGKVIKISNY